MTLQKQLEYVYPKLLVDTQWVEDHLNDPKVRIAEVDYDRNTNYELGDRIYSTCGRFHVNSRAKIFVIRDWFNLVINNSIAILYSIFFK
jgi:hypothetical protein